MALWLIVYNIFINTQMGMTCRRYRLKCDSMEGATPGLYATVIYATVIYATVVSDLPTLKISSAVFFINIAAFFGHDIYYSECKRLSPIK